MANNGKDENKNAQSNKETWEKLYKFVLLEMQRGADKESIKQKLIDIGIKNDDATLIVDTTYNEILKQVEKESVTYASIIPACIGGMISALVGGFLWGLIVNITNYEIGYMAVGIGVLVGFVVVVFSGGRKGIPIQVIAVLASLLGIFIGKYFIFVHQIKKFVIEQFGKGLIDLIKVNFYSLEYFGDFINSLTERLSGFDALWLFLAVASAWKITKNEGIKLPKDYKRTPESIKVKIAVFVFIGLLILIPFQILKSTLAEKKSSGEEPIGVQSYTSNNYGYKITVPNNWKIIKRTDFKKEEIDEEAEIVLETIKAVGSFWIIPSKLEDIRSDFDMETMKNAAIATMKDNTDIQLEDVKETDYYGESGFELRHSFDVKGNKVIFIWLSNLHNGVCITVRGRAMGEKAGEVLEELENIAKNIKFINE